MGTERSPKSIPLAKAAFADTQVDGLRRENATLRAQRAGGGRPQNDITLRMETFCSAAPGDRRTMGEAAHEGQGNP